AVAHLGGPPVPTRPSSDLLMRRSAAGEIAALAGPRALPFDLAQRPFDFRRRAREVVATLPARHRAWLDAYVEGVAAGLADLGARADEHTSELQSRENLV